MKLVKRSLAAVLVLCLVLNLGLIIPVQADAYSNAHTIILSSTLQSDGSYSHTAVYNGSQVTEYDYTWHADPSSVHTEVSNSPAEYYTGTKPGNEAVYVAHDIYYYPELPTSGFTKMNYDGEQEWCYYYTATGYTGYIFSTLPGKSSSVPTSMMHSAEDAYHNAVLHITQPGDYVIEGTWHGQIWVDLANYCDDPFTDPTAKVNLILNGVTIDCSVAAGLVFYNVYECDNTWEDQSSWSYNVDTSAAGAVVTLADGTVNSVTGTNIFRILKTQYKSGSTSVQKKRLKIDGSFYSYQSMRIQGGSKGTGVLNITAGYEGLDSELHLTVDGGNVNIFSQDDGINVNEDGVSVLSINGGNLHILAGLGSEGDGIDSNGFITVRGGTTISMANPGADSGMDSDFGTYVFGGNVIAMGSTMDWVENDTSVVYDQATMNLQFSSSRSAGDAVVVTDTAGNGIFAYDPDKDEINGSQVRTYTGAVVSCENFVIGESYNVYIGGEVTGTETMGVYDMTTVTAVSSTNQQSYSGTSSSGGNGRPSMGGGSSSGSSGNTTFTLSNNVSKFTGVANYSTGTSITVTPMEGGGEAPVEKTYYLFGYINGANYACEEDYENMGQYQFVDGKLTATFTADSYVAVKEADNANWYMAQSYCTDTTCNLYNTATGAAEKMLVPGNVEVTFTLTENADGSLTLSYTAETTECNHSYTSQITTAATCTAAGVRTFTCSNCGDTYTQTIAATGHSYTSKITTAATCTADGVQTFSCSNCGDTYTQAIAATGHSYSNGICTVCGAADPNGSVTDGSYVQVTDVSQITAGGKFVIVANNSGSYYAMGTDISGGKASGMAVTVSNNVVVGENLPVWEVEAVDSGVSFYANGSYLAYTSSSSGGGFGGMSGNNFTTSTTAYAWTVSAGESGYTVCNSSGNRYIYFRTSSSAFGPYSSFNSFMGGYITELLFFKYQAAEESCTHSYSGEITTAAGCESEGVMTYTCSNCGDSYTEPIAAIGHHYTETVEAATCTQDGSKIYTCSNCGNSYSETIAATGHSYADGVCTTCGAADPNAVLPSKTYYLFGYINGANYACEEDYENMGEYLFVNGRLTATFATDSYVAVKEADNAAWYMTSGWQGTEVTSVTLYNTNTGITADKLYVPGGVQVTFNLVENTDGTLTLSYTTASTQPSTAPTISLKYPTLVFEDVIMMNVYFDASQLEDVAEMGLITYKTSQTEYSIDTADAVIPGYNWSEADQLYYATTEGIAAKDLGDEIYFAVYAKLSDGTYYYTRMVSYSPEKYAYAQLATGGAEMKPIVVAMLNYGSAAQTYFGYNTESLVNRNLTDEQKALIEAYREDMIATVTAPTAEKQGIFAKNGGHVRRYPTISFEGAFCINYYYTPSYQPVGDITMYYWNQIDFNAASVLTKENATAAIKMNGEGVGQYHAAVEGIAAKDLDQGVYVAFTYSDGTTTYYSGVLAYSIGAYCGTQANATDGTAPLAMATAVYGYYAQQLFYKK